MSTKKIILVVISVFAVLGLIAALFIGGISLFVFQTIRNSDAAEASRTFLRNNEKLKQDIGQVKDFGWFVTGQINVQNADGEATLHLKVIGERKDVDATVVLSYRSNRNWRVIGASYVRDGQTISLLEPYDMPPAL